MYNFTLEFDISQVPLTRDEIVDATEAVGACRGFKPNGLLCVEFYLVAPNASEAGQIAKDRMLRRLPGAVLVAASCGLMGVIV